MNGRKNRNVQEGSRCLKYKKTSSKIRLGRKFIVETRFHRRNKIEKKKSWFIKTMKKFLKLLLTRRYVRIIKLKLLSIIRDLLISFITTRRGC